MYSPNLSFKSLVSLCCLVIGVSPLLGQVEEASLFRGMKVTVDDGGDEYPVIGIDGDRYVISKNGEQRTLPAKSSIITQPIARFSRQVIEITEDTFELTSTAYSQLVQQRDQMRALQMTSRVLIDVKNETVDVEDFSSEPRVMDIDRKIAEAAQNPDTIAAKLTVNAPSEQPDLYLLGLVYFTVEQDGVKRPAYKGQLQEVGTLLAGESKELSIEISDLPQNIEVDRMAYHFYSRGEEIATNQSEKRRVLSEEETYDYLLHRYMAAAAGKSRGPSLFKPIKKNDVSRFLDSDQMSAVILNLLIDENGRVEDVSVQSGLSQWQIEVSQLVEQARFFPSLDNGQPVEKQLKLRLSQIAL